MWRPELHILSLSCTLCPDGYCEGQYQMPYWNTKILCPLPSLHPPHRWSCISLLRALSEYYLHEKFLIAPSIVITCFLHINYSSDQGRVLFYTYINKVNFSIGLSHLACLLYTILSVQRFQLLVLRLDSKNTNDKFTRRVLCLIFLHYTLIFK